MGCATYIETINVGVQRNAGSCQKLKPTFFMEKRISTIRLCLGATPSSFSGGRNMFMTPYVEINKIYKTVHSIQDGNIIVFIII